MLTILEVSNFDHPRSTERRRAGAGRVRWVLVAPGEGTWTQARGRELLIEHVQGRRVAGSERRVLVEASRLRALVQLHRPAVIVCGSPALMPALVHLSGFRLDPRPALIGAWHADVSGAFVQRELGRLDRRLGQIGGRALGWWTKQGLGSFDAVVVGSHSAARELWARGVDRIYVAPRGVDLERFSPQRDVPEWVGALRAGAARMIIGVDAPSREGVGLLSQLRACLCRRLDRDPALIVHARPSEALDRFAAAHPHVYVQTFDDADTRARCLAGCDLAVVLSGRDGGWTGCAEAMASGCPVVGAGQGGVELVGAAGCGRGLAEPDAERLVTGVLELVRGGGLVALGGLGRRFIERYDADSCEARELVCYEEVLAHVRSGRRVAAGIHERMQPVGIGPSN